jgi:hypothetical protein
VESNSRTPHSGCKKLRLFCRYPVTNIKPASPP